MDNLAYVDGRPVDVAAVLTKAFLNAGDLLELSQRELADIVGVSEATLSRVCRTDSKNLEEGTKTFELAVWFVRIYRSLDALVGGNTEKARAWLRAPNVHLGAPPVELLKTIGGITDVARYLDAMRGRV